MTGVISRPVTPASESAGKRNLLSATRHHSISCAAALRAPLQAEPGSAALRALSSAHHSLRYAHRAVRRAPVGAAAPFRAPGDNNQTVIASALDDFCAEKMKKVAIIQ